MKKDWLRRCDFLNVPTSLSYKKEYFYSTYVGAVLTILFMIAIVLIITYEVVILSQRSSFKLITNQYTDLNQTIDFSQNAFIFQIINDNGRTMNEDPKLFFLQAYIMELSIKYENGTKKRKLTNIPIEMETCDKIYSNLSYYSELNLSQFFCFKPGQNLTAFGLLGDRYNPYKGIRIYINRCVGDNCYDDEEFEKKFHNSKFMVTYLSLSSNMFNIKNTNYEYQTFTQTCSLSANILKKITLTFNVGKFELYNNVIFRNKMEFNYILGNDYSSEVDLDFTSTMKKQEYTLAYISFFYGGNVFQTRKEVQTLYEALSIIGNFFNIIFTIFRVVNNYFANKILFVDIFDTVFFSKEKEKRINNDNANAQTLIRIKKNNNLANKINMDLSEEIGFQNNNNNIDKNKYMNLQKKRRMSAININNIKLSKIKTKETAEFRLNKIRDKLKYYYLLPLWILRRYNYFKNTYLIKDKICGYFSIEKMNELIKYKEMLEKNKPQPKKIIGTDILKNKNSNIGLIDEKIN